MAYTTKSFIEKARAVHDDKYDYSKVEYKGTMVPVCIICPEHGEFWQKPQHHLFGNGCKKCGIERAAQKVKQEKENWVIKARKTHGDKYDYSKVEYKGWKDKVCIICPEHGEFWQNPTDHIRKQHPSGCPECGKLKSQTYNKEIYGKTTNGFVADAIKIHGDKYDYSKVEYINAKTKVCIICPEHGEFWKTAAEHLKGSGCPKCMGYGLKTDEIVEKFILAHGNKYDYSKVEYKNSQTKVCIICPEHGEFWQTPSKHLNGKGCYECWKEKKFLSYEKCYNIAKQYLFKRDFFLEQQPAYNKARNEGWLDDFDWLLTKTDNSDKRIIYVYEFSDGAAYVGLTNWVERRDYEHRWNKNVSSVYEYSIQNNIEIPVIKILEENVNSDKAGSVENKWINFYRKNNWKMINKVRGGAIGGGHPSKKYTKEQIIEETKQYKNQEEVYNKNRPLYNAMRRFRVVKECFPKTHFKPKTTEQYDYTEEFLKEITTKYKKKSELRKNEYRVYQWLYMHNRLYDFYEKASEGNMNKKKKVIF